MERVWWEQITNARGFLQKTVDAALSGKSVLLSLPEYIPWYDALRDGIETELNNLDASKTFECLSSPESEIGKFLLYRYCGEEKRGKYRPSLTYPVFLAQCSDIVLNDRYIWVEDIPKNCWKEWMDFLSMYHIAMRKDKRPAVFILVCRESGLKIPSKRQIVQVNYWNLVHNYDSFTFCTLAASDSPCRAALRPYLAELAYSLCGNDIELCAACIASGQRFLEAPETALRDIIRTQRRSSGEPFCYDLSPDAVGRRIWESQIKTVFPLIEHYRHSFVERYARGISQNLPLRGSAYEEIEEPQDVELGLLFYLVKGCSLHVHPDEYDRLELFRNARNRLAHLKPLALEMIEEIYRFVD